MFFQTNVINNYYTTSVVKAKFKRIVTCDDTLEISMAADGGQAISFVPVQ
jgi:3-hydroxymyristoyl/3-hydroxydecanoyl-(acyl carrier protein) dehydratase